MSKTKEALSHTSEEAFTKIKPSFPVHHKRATAIQRDVFYGNRRQACTRHSQHKMPKQLEARIAPENRGSIN